MNENWKQTAARKSSTFNVRRVCRHFSLKNSLSRVLHDKINKKSADLSTACEERTKKKVSSHWRSEKFKSQKLPPEAILNSTKIPLTFHRRLNSNCIFTSCVIKLLIMRLELRVSTLLLLRTHVNIKFLHVMTFRWVGGRKRWKLIVEVVGWWEGSVLLASLWELLREVFCGSRIDSFPWIINDEGFLWAEAEED